MLYKEKEEHMGNHWYSYCHDNLGKRYQQWMVPVRLLEITPAEYAELMVTKYNAKLRYCKNSWNGQGFLMRYWDSQADMRKWKNYINKVAREKGFQI